MDVEWMYVQDLDDDALYEIYPDQYDDFIDWLRNGNEDDYSGIDFELYEVKPDFDPVGKTIHAIDIENM